MLQVLEDLSGARLTLQDVLQSHLQASPVLAAATVNQTLPELATAMERYFVRRTLADGEVLFEQGSPGHFVFIVLSGCVASIVDFLQFAAPTTRTSAADGGCASVSSPKPEKSAQLFAGVELLLSVFLYVTSCYWPLHDRTKVNSGSACAAEHRKWQRQRCHGRGVLVP
jgi:hypothetical protein